MRATVVAALATALASVGGCQTPSYGRPDAGPYEAQPFPPLPPATSLYLIAPGVGAVLQPTPPAHFGVTGNSRGAYRVIWTSLTQAQMTGSLWTSGHFTSLTLGCVDGTCAFGSKDRVTGPIDVDGGQRIDIDSEGAQQAKGITLISDTDPVILALYVNGTERPDLVALAERGTGRVKSSTVSPFAVTAD